MSPRRIRDQTAYVAAAVSQNSRNSRDRADPRRLPQLCTLNTTSMHVFARWSTGSPLCAFITPRKCLKFAETYSFFLLRPGEIRTYAVFLKQDALLFSQDTSSNGKKCASEALFRNAPNDATSENLHARQALPMATTGNGCHAFSHISSLSPSRLQRQPHPIPEWPNEAKPI